jgi:hypothetical protein
MKKKIIALANAAFALAAAFLLALPGAAFAAPAVEAAEAAAAAEAAEAAAAAVEAAAVVEATKTAGDNITVEYRYAEGEVPNITASISQFGQTYHLVGISDAVLESTLPTTRTYTYRVSGALTPAQLAEVQAAGEVSVTPVYLDREAEADVPHTFTGLETNDVEDLLAVARAMGIAGLLNGTAYEGGRFNVLELSDVSYTPTGWEDAAHKLPNEYTAECILRGVVITEELGYYLASATFTTHEAADEINQYIVVAEYAPEAQPPLVEEEEEEAPGEEDPMEVVLMPEIVLPATGLSDADAARVDSQGNNPLANIANGLTPLGGLSVAGVWSFLSLILSVLGVVIAIFYVVGFAIRRGRVKNYENLGVYDGEALVLIQKRGNLLRILTILFGALTLVTWLILDDFTVGMVWVNANTIVVAAFFIVTAILCGVTNARKAKADRYATEEADTEIV